MSVDFVLSLRLKGDADPAPMRLNVLSRTFRACDSVTTGNTIARRTALWTWLGMSLHPRGIFPVTLTFDNPFLG